MLVESHQKFTLYTDFVLMNTLSLALQLLWRPKSAGLSLLNQPLHGFFELICWTLLLNVLSGLLEENNLWMALMVQVLV